MRDHTKQWRDPPIQDWRQRLVLLGYSNKSTVKLYASREPVLWKAEEILIGRYFPPGSSVLDIGCGTGRTTIPLARMGYRVTGIDVAPKMLERAHLSASREHLDLDFRVMDARQLGFPGETYDNALFSYNGIELLPGIEGKRKVFREVWRVLRPGGHFILTSHSMYALNGLFGFRIRSLLRFYAARLLGLKAEGQEAGERIIGDHFETGYMQIIPPRRMKRLAKKEGFVIEDDRTRGRIEDGKRPGWFMDFEVTERCYVLRKGVDEAEEWRTGPRRGRRLRARKSR